MKRILSVIIAFCMAMALCVNAFAAEVTEYAGGLGLSTLSVNVDETVDVVVSFPAKALATVQAGVCFDTEYLEVVSINVPGADDMTGVGLSAASGVDAANETGLVTFAYVGEMGDNALLTESVIITMKGLKEGRTVISFSEEEVPLILETLQEDGYSPEEQFFPETTSVTLYVCNHTLYEELADEKYLISPGSCTSEAVYYVSCALCGMAGEETFTVAPLGHDWGEWIVTEPATCVAEGEKVRVCGRDDSHQETVVLEIDENGHIYEETVTAPGLYSQGYTTNVCSECGYTYDGSYTDPLYLNMVGWNQYDSNWYYFTSKGVPAQGWKKISGVWYYFDDTGLMQTGWHKIDGKWYHFKTGGAMQTGWFESDRDGDGTTEWFYLTSSGAKTGWYSSGSWYYFDAEGVMQTGWHKIDGKWYYFYSGGSLRTGWFYTDKDGDGAKEYYYLTSSGAATGWKKVSGTWYYFDTQGVMQTGWHKIDGKWYYFYSGGSLRTGWFESDRDGDGTTEWFYLTSSGAYANRWLKSGGYWYWFDAEGVMVSNTTVSIKGVSYTFDAAGHMI